MSDIEKTLKERGDRYGSFFDHAMIAQNLQDTMRKCEGWEMLAPDQKQALTVISDKIARMLNGQPDYRDNWHDIVGYAKLVDDRLALAELPTKNDAAWTSHDGSECPVNDGAEIDILYRDGSEMIGTKCEPDGPFWRWDENSNEATDIMGYRVYG